MELQEKTWSAGKPFHSALGMVTRLVEAKGLDLVTRIMMNFWNMKMFSSCFWVQATDSMKTGSKVLYGVIRKKYPPNIFFNNELAHQIYAASDMFLMPSQYEPCGIGQLIALRYGSIPIVRATGGLKDTVEAFNNYTNIGNGFSSTTTMHMNCYSPSNALSISINELSKRQHIMENAMTADYSWNESAKQYKDYITALQNNNSFS